MATVQNSLKTSFTKMPPAVQLLAFVVLIGLVYFLIKSIFSKIGMKFNEQQVNAEIQAYEAAGYSASFPPSQYKTLAQQIFQAVDGNGTDTESVVDAFLNLQNDIDVLELEKAYMKVETDPDFDSLGARLRYESEGWGGFSWGADSTVEDVNAVLASKGITRRY